jgi:hypothetical protein
MSGGDRSYRVLLVAGTGQNGATIMSRVLSQVPGFVAVGELGHLWDKGLIENRACGCGEPFLACPFWSRVGEVAFGGWSQVDARDLTRLRGTLLLKRTPLPHPFALPLLRWPGISRSYERALRRYRGAMLRVYDGIADASGAQHIVDSMKVPGHVYTVAGMPQVDPFLVHLVRDARGVAYSSMKKVLRQGTDADPYRVRRPPAKSALRWMWINESFDRLAKRVPSTLVRYETFVEHPADEIARIATEAGVPVGPGDLTTIDGRSVSLPPDHLFAGNRVRFSEGPVELREDVEWQTSVARDTQRRIATLARPLLTRYGYDPAPAANAPA